MSSFTTVIAAAAFVFGTIAPASAQNAAMVRVATHDLNLASEKGQRALNLRIDRAARQLCDTVNSRFSSAVRVAQRQCRDAAIATAQASVTNRTRLATR